MLTWDMNKTKITRNTLAEKHSRWKWATYLPNCFLTKRFRNDCFTCKTWRTWIFGNIMFVAFPVEVSEDFSADHLWFRNYEWWHFSVNFHFFFKISDYLNFEAHNSAFQPIMLKRSEQWKSICSAFLRTKNTTFTHFFWIFWCYSSEETDMAQVFKIFSRWVE